jgi:alpha/beta superfamily hydrolase
MEERDYDFSFLLECRKPLLLVHGEHDEFASPDEVRALAARLPPEARARVHVIPGAGHFFDDQLEELRRVIAEWTQEMMNAE